MVDAVRSSRQKLGFEETELRLGIGLPEKNNGNYGKRGFDETVDLKLNLSSNENTDDSKLKNLNAEEEKNSTQNNGSVKPAAKAQVVGWPPVRSLRKISMAVQEKAEPEGSGAASFVKVSMDGAPYLRKVDLRMYKSYQELSEALGKMFSSFTMGKCESEAMKEKVNGSEYVPTYEDKDGDWMLVGDVPWEMFVESCKRLRIMKGSEAKGLPPRAMEKFKSGN